MPTRCKFTELRDPVVYHTPGGEIECKQEVSFPTKVQDDKGAWHNFEFTGCVTDERCPPLLAARNLQELSIRRQESGMMAAHFGDGKRVFPLKPIGRSGLWSIACRTF